MSDTIKRWECPECGRASLESFDGGHGEMSWRPEGCPGVPVERTYVAQDADGLAEYRLGRHEGRQELIDALLTAAEGVDVWKIVEHGRGMSSSTVARKPREIVQAAIAAATGEQA